MHHLLYFNGTEAAMSKLFGCPCNRCNDDNRRANVSVSLISHDGAGKTLHHVLFDVGDGVTTSLVRSPWLKHTNSRLDQIILSHWHRDHTLHLNRVLTSNFLRGERLKINPKPRVPVWARSGSAAWVDELYDYERDKFMELHSSGEEMLPGTLIDRIDLPAIPAIQITPFALSHFSADISVDRQNYVSSCAGFVIQGPNKKVIFFWDADTSNEAWVTNPQSAEQEATVTLLQDADYLIIDTIVWLGKNDREYQHLSFPRTMNIAKALRPKVTMPVHISGHPDLPGNGAWGWSDEEWQENGAKAWAEQDAPGDYVVPTIGYELDL